MIVLLRLKYQYIEIFGNNNTRYRMGIKYWNKGKIPYCNSNPQEEIKRTIIVNNINKKHYKYIFSLLSFLSLLKDIRLYKVIIQQCIVGFLKYIDVYKYV